jgi:hypothetical protein
MSAKLLRSIPSKAEPASIPVPLVGTICGYDPERGLLVDFPQNPTPGPLAARWTMPLDTQTLERAVREQQQAVLLFEEGSALRPIVTGLLQPLTALPPTQVQFSEPLKEARLDGKRLTFEAAEEIVLRCGQASLILRKNGAVQIKGAYVLTQSSGVNRIRGGSVQIN